MYVWSGGMDQGSASADTYVYCLAGELWADCNAAIGSPGAMQNCFEFSAWLSNGFQINKLVTGRSGVNVFALVIQGGSWTVGDFLSRGTAQGVGTIVESGFGYQPNGLIVVSPGQAATTSPNNVIHDQLSFGVTDGATHHTQGHVDEDGVANMEVGTTIDFDKVYADISTADTVLGHIDWTSWDGDGFTLTQNDTDTQQNFCFYIACGSEAVIAASPSTAPILQAVNRSTTY